MNGWRSTDLPFTPAQNDVGENVHVWTDRTYVAHFNAEAIKYKITFVDSDGTVLKEATEYELSLIHI